MTSVFKAALEILATSDYEKDLSSIGGKSEWFKVHGKNVKIEGNTITCDCEFSSLHAHKGALCKHKIAIIYIKIMETSIEMKREDQKFKALVKEALGITPIDSDLVKTLVEEGLGTRKGIAYVLTMYCDGKEQQIQNSPEHSLIQLDDKNVSAIIWKAIEYVEKKEGIENDTELDK